MGTASRGDVGMLGEAIATRFFKDRGYQVLAQNYRKPWGEIDIVAQKGKILHFVEVKSGATSSLELDLGGEGAYRPEENVHTKKLTRLVKTIYSFLDEEKPECSEWQLDVAVVLFSKIAKKARVHIISDVLAG